MKPNINATKLVILLVKILATCEYLENKQKLETKKLKININSIFLLHSSEKTGCLANFTVRLKNKLSLTITDMQLQHNHEPESVSIKIFQYKIKSFIYVIF